MATTKEYGLGSSAFPRGWFMIAESRSLGAAPLSLRAFGRDLVLYRGTNGPILMDAYCPHMGTHIGRSTASFVVQDGLQIEGDSIRCPYHAWRFGPDGRCNQIPYYDGAIPKNATIRTWPVRESMGCLFMWHDAEANDPHYEPPTLAEWDDDDWVRWELDDLGTLPTHPVEIIDNMADVRHFDALHGSTVSYFHVQYAGHRYFQYQGGGHRTLTTGELLETITHYEGPGILISRQYGSNTVIQFICHTPIEDGVVHVWHGILYKAPSGGRATPQDIVDARNFQAVARTSFTQDFEIWGNKQPAFNITMVPTDGPFDKGRIWYSQFYKPAEQAAAIHRRIDGASQCRDLPASLLDVGHAAASRVLVAGAA
jgi:3-ketosteroid 9alpha-monooxygenase subunit A